jgi:hypothetical protein
MVGPGLYAEIGKKTKGGCPSVHLAPPSPRIPFKLWVSGMELRWIFLVWLTVPLLSFSADLLYKDYQTDHKFTLTTYTSNGVVSAPLRSKHPPSPLLRLRSFVLGRGRAVLSSDGDESGWCSCGMGSWSSIGFVCGVRILLLDLSEWVAVW